MAHGNPARGRWCTLDRAPIVCWRSLVRAEKLTDGNSWPRHFHSITRRKASFGFFIDRTGAILLHHFDIIESGFTLRELIFVLMLVSQVQIVLNQLTKA